MPGIRDRKQHERDHLSDDWDMKKRQSLLYIWCPLLHHRGERLCLSRLIPVQVERVSEVDVALQVQPILWDRTEQPCEADRRIGAHAASFTQEFVNRLS